MDHYKPDSIEHGALGRLIDVIANAANAGWGETTRTAFLLIIGSVAIALVMTAGLGHV
jgi:hypothetical protein